MLYLKGQPFGAIRQNWLLTKYLGLQKFAKGVMWIQRYILGIESKYLLVDTDSNIGGKIMEIVINGGNFGFYNPNNNYYGSKYWRVIAQCKQNVGKIVDFPTETLSQPLFILWHQWWKWQINYRTKLETYKRLSELF